jgi:hypothetical protein
MATIPNPYESPAAVTTVVTEVEPWQQDEIDEQQRYVNRLLNRGVIFTFFWIGGIGSLYSLYLAAKAHRIIRESQGTIGGHGRVWWCYLNGGFGALLAIGGLLVVVYNSLQP